MPPLPPRPEQSSPVQMSLGAPPRFRLAHRAITFQVKCTTWCVGSAGYEVSVRARNKQVTRFASLGAPQVPFSITATNGSWTFVRHLPHTLVRRLRQLLRRHDAVTITILARVTDQTGHEAKTEQTARLVA
jgi:hypothetical protein